MKSLKFILLSIIGFIAMVSSTATLVSQTPLPASMDEYYSFGDDYFIEVATMPGTTPGRSRVTVLFRITYDAITFRRVQQTIRSQGQYVGTPSMYVEAVDSEGVISGRGMWRDTAYASSYSMTNSKRSFIGGSIDLALRPGKYALRYTIDDGTPAGTDYVQTIPSITVDDFNGQTPAIGTPIFLKNISGDTLTAAAIDGKAPIGKLLRAVIPVKGPGPIDRLQYELRTLSTESNIIPSPKTGTLKPVPNLRLSNAIATGNDVQFIVQRNSNDQSGESLVLLEITSKDLDIGSYKLILICETASKQVSDTVSFDMRWVDMPLSLQLPDYGIKALYPIATQDQIDDMLSSGNKAKQAEVLRNFWKSKDPTPKSIYNEAMAEYFRRVDYSYFNFKSTDQPDGAFTDRGKIYILYGPPSNVQRDLYPDGPAREVWTYNNRVARTFVFSDVLKNGYYRLTEYHDLKK